MKLPTAASIAKRKARGLKASRTCRLKHPDRVKAGVKAYRDANLDKVRAREKRYRTECSGKVKASSNKYRAANRAKVLAKYKSWRLANLAKVRARENAFNAAHREETRSRYHAWRAANPDKAAANELRRRAAQHQAEPSWADKNAIAAMYKDAELLTIATGIPHVVDHIYPLRGRTVSGLHVHWNMRAITALDNMRKGNRYPDVATVAAITRTGTSGVESAPCDGL